MISKEEFINNVRNIQSAEDYRKFAAEQGIELPEDKAEEAFALMRSRLSPEGKELDEEEMASVNAAGQSSCFSDSFNHCYATVEVGSWCMGSDACMYVYHLYNDVTLT